MRTFRFIGMALFAILMCVNFTACSNDDDEGNFGSSKRLVGTWNTDFNWTDCINWVYIFNADGTYTTKAGVYESQKGRYTYKNPILTLSGTDGTSIFTIVSFENDYFVVMTDGGRTATFYKDTDDGEKQFVSGNVQNHDYVDLGLSVKWAICNVGASNITDGGDIFAWGETRTKNEYNWDNYKWTLSARYDLTKYCTKPKYGYYIYGEYTDGGMSVDIDLIDFRFTDNLTTLESSDDAATVNWGSKWRMPTNEEFEELRNKCKWEKVNFNGYIAYKVTGPNGNSIFFIAKWLRGNSPGTYYYWTSTLDEYSNDCAYAYEIEYLNNNWGANGREKGYLIRPVTE